PAVTGCSIGGASNNVLSCSFATLAPGADVSIHLTSTATKDQCGSLTNPKATVGASNEPTANQGNNDSASVTITVQCPDVTVTKTTKTATVSAGDAISFDLVVHNGGAGTATTVTV